MYLSDYMLTNRAHVSIVSTSYSVINVVERQCMRMVNLLSPICGRAFVESNSVSTYDAITTTLNAETLILDSIKTNSVSCVCMWGFRPDHVRVNGSFYWLTISRKPELYPLVFIYAKHFKSFVKLPFTNVHRFNILMCNFGATSNWICSKLVDSNDS